jgi:hypothetical protein
LPVASARLAHLRFHWLRDVHVGAGHKELFFGEFLRRETTFVLVVNSEK